MKYSIERLPADVLARLGEIGAENPAPVPPEGGDGEAAWRSVPWPADVIALKVRAMLGEVGAKLIREASASLLRDAGEIVSPPSGGRRASPVASLMPCGLYAAEVRLPERFLRLGSVKMTGWRHGVTTLICPDSPEWSRQWSAEAGIAGCPERPRAYLDSDADGRLLRLVGSEDEDDALEWLTGWTVPEPDEEGEFDFPAPLYPQLVGGLADAITA